MRYLTNDFTHRDMRHHGRLNVEPELDQFAAPINVPTMREWLTSTAVANVE